MKSASGTRPFASTASPSKDARDQRRPVRDTASVGNHHEHRGGECSRHRQIRDRDVAVASQPAEVARIAAEYHAARSPNSRRSTMKK